MSSVRNVFPSRAFRSSSMHSLLQLLQILFGDAADDQPNGANLDSSPGLTNRFIALVFLLQYVPALWANDASASRAKRCPFPAF